MHTSLTVLSPPDHAFVVQLSRFDPGHPWLLQGRVEHVATGTALRFESPAQLLSFLQRIVAQLPAPASARFASELLEPAP